jgi:hypothetical protein
VPELPWHPAGTKTRCLGDLPELAPHVVVIQWRADRGREEQAVILTQRSRFEPVGGLPLVVLAKRLRGQLRQPKDASALARLGVSTDPRGAVDRNGARVEVNLVPPKRPKLFGPLPCHHRQHTYACRRESRAVCSSTCACSRVKLSDGCPVLPPRRLDHSRHIPADQVADLGVADGPLQAVAQDLKAAGRQPVCQRIQGRLDIPGGEFAELEVSQPLPEWLDGVPVELPGPTCRSGRQPASHPVIQRVADRVGRARPDSVVEFLTQLPKLGLNGGLCPAGHGPAHALPRLVPERDGADQWLLAWSK